ncbi:hypothetical protein QRX50_16610 [Amycolatopsis carbonis]|uniref:Uncharacterized protein n=1 Tax=Amycolatopsis carbonis TaxID=715471 RepID=A0A9Y2IN11_9PSEU|nr:hypothetical protein [Amycolatopsis sp. 2-15]WIX82261.1 hypothetical protein QRX50_16610 [Amycolatopsis sp. 2-15]
MKNVSKAALGLLAAGAMMTAVPGVGSAATSEPTKPVTNLRNGIVSYVSSDGRGCGATVAGWDRYYHHCTNDGRPIQVLARFVFVGNTMRVSARARR